MGKQTLIRPDGSEIQATPEEADKLRVLGYKDQTPEQLAGSAIAESTERYYTSPDQKIATGLEGLAGGATLGLSDLALDAAGAETSERGQYNPGIRLGTELIGGLLPMAPGILGAAAKFTPAGLLASGAKAVGTGLAEGKVAQTAITGAIEGGGFGGGAAASQSVINGDPLTAESIMAGVGWGSVWGGGLGLGFGKLAARAEAKAAARLELETAEAAQGAALRNTEQAWGEFRSGIHDASGQAKLATQEADRLFESSQVFSAKRAVQEAGQVKNAVFNEFMVNATRDPEAVALHKEAGKAYGAIGRAAKAGDYQGLQAATERFNAAVTALGNKTGIAVPEIAGFTAAGAKKSVKAATEVAELKAAAEHLQTLPLTPEKFAKMPPARAEKAFAAVDSFLGSNHPELAGVREGLKAGIDKLEVAAGVTFDGSPAAKLRNVYENLAGQLSKKAEKAVAKAASGVPPWLVGAGAAAMARKAGMGSLGASAVYYMTKGLLGLKSAVVGTLSKVATEWAPRALVKATPFVSRIEPLAVRLDGTEDKGKATRKELMTQRAAEIREAAGSVRDTMYRSLSPLADHHPDLAASMHELGVKQFMFLMDKLPRDPGLAFNRLRSLWSPDPAQTEKFSRYYEVFQNPVAVVQSIMKTGVVKPEWAEGLREMHPALFAELRVNMLERLSDPAILNKLTYNQQVSLGTLLQIPLHSTMTPQFVASQQQMYQERQKLIPMPPQPGADQGGGRPPGASKSASSAQKITEH